MTKPTAKEDHRRERRDSLFLLADMLLVDHGETVRIKLRNISQRGLMAECPLRAARGERVVIELRNIGPVGGRVAWGLENRFGVVLDHEIDPKAVRQPLAVSEDVPEMCVRRPLIREEAAPDVDPATLRRI